MIDTLKAACISITRVIHEVRAAHHPLVGYFLGPATANSMHAAQA